MLNKLIIFIFMIISFSVIAQDTDFIESIDQRINSKKYQYEYDVKKQSVIKKKEGFNASKYNNQNHINLFLGIQQEQYEEINNVFVEAVTPTIELTFKKRFTESFGYDYRIHASKKSIVPKIDISFGNSFLSGFHYFLFSSIGGKIAMTEQMNSGYWFMNTGLGIGTDLLGFEINGRVYSHFKEYKYQGFELSILRKYKESKFGISFALDEYNPFEMKYERDGQRNMRAGFIYSY